MKKLEVKSVIFFSEIPFKCFFAGHTVPLFSLASFAEKILRHEPRNHVTKPVPNITVTYYFAKNVTNKRHLNENKCHKQFLSFIGTLLMKRTIFKRVIARARLF